MHFHFLMKNIRRKVIILLLSTSIKKPLVKKKVKKIKLFKILISFGSSIKFLDEIIAFGKLHQSSYVCVANVHMCIEVEKDTAFREIVNKADIITPDGKPLVLALKSLYGIEQERVSGPDLMPALLKAAEKENLKVYFYVNLSSY